jgi:transposase
MKSYVAVDLHRRRSVVMRRCGDGSTTSVRIENSPDNLVEAVFAGHGRPHVAIEATYGWYWAADCLDAAGAKVHLVHPLGLNWGNRRVKNDHTDAEALLDLLERGRLPEAWISPPHVRELRELVRARHKLVGDRTRYKNQIHAVLAKHCLFAPVTDAFGPGGRAWLDTIALEGAYKYRVDATLDLVDHLDAQIGDYDQVIARTVRTDPAYRALTTIPRVGPVLAAVFIAEIGDIARFNNANQLTCWAGLTPRVRSSDNKTRHGSISKQGSRLVRWAAIEAVAKQPNGSHLHTEYQRHLDRRGRPGIAKVAIARKLLRLVFFAMRDLELRCLQPDAQSGEAA